MEHNFLEMIDVLVFRTLRDLIMFPNTWEMHLDEAIKSNGILLGLKLDPEQSAKVRRMVDLEIKHELNPPDHSNKETLDPFKDKITLTSHESSLIIAGKKIEAIKTIRGRTGLTAQQAKAIVDSHTKEAI